MFISGCDSLFARRIDISGVETGITLSDVESLAVLKSIQKYAKDEGIFCRDSGQLPIECWRQPIRIWAVYKGKKITVCYRATGIPLESGKFEKRMDRLEKKLRTQFDNVIAVAKMQCPEPPLYLNNSDVRKQ